jgi:hypothetical protein
MEPIRVMRQSTSVTPDSFREKTEVETEFIRRKALVMELRGTETVINGQLEADATHLVYMHGSDKRAREITPEDWILRTSKGNARLNIIWIRAVGTDGMEIEMQCTDRITE